MTAEQLISALVEGRLRAAAARPGFISTPKAIITKSSFLSAIEVASLKPRQGIIVNGKKGRVIQVEVRHGKVSLTYVRGAKSFGPEQTLVFDKTQQKTPVQYFSKEYVDEEWTKGMKNAARKRLSDSQVACPACGYTLPRYPGRYPKSCPECGEPLSPKDL